MPTPFGSMGRLLIGAGLFLVVIGLLFLLGGKFPVGSDSGDIIIRRGNFTFLFSLRYLYSAEYTSQLGAGLFTRRRLRGCLSQ